MQKRKSSGVIDKKLKTNMMYNMAYQVLTILLPIVLSPYLARVLGADGIGEYNYTFTIASYFSLFCILGIRTYGNRECAIKREDRNALSTTFWSIYIVQLVSSVIAVVVYIIYIYAIAHEYQKLLLIQGIYILSVVLDITWLFYGLEQFKKIVIRNIIVKLGILLTVLTFVKTSDDVWIYCLCMALSALFSQIAIWPFALKYVDKVTIHKQDIRLHLCPVLSLFIPVIGVSIYSGIDKLMIGRMIDMQSVGFYSNAEGLVKLPYGIVTAITAVMLPRLSLLISRKEFNKNREYVHSTMRLNMALALPICFGLAAIAPELVPWYYTEEFMECVPLIQMLVIIILFLAWTEVLQSHYLIPMRMDKVLMKAAIIAAVFNVVANLALIPRFGVEGAVWGTILTEGIVMIYKTYYARKSICLFRSFKELLPFCILSVFMFLVVRLIGFNMGVTGMLTTFIQISAGAVFYGAGVLILHVLEL